MAIDSVVLGFGHRARSGKDTAIAEIIRRRSTHGYDATQTTTFPQTFYDIRRYGFGDELKKEVNQALDAFEPGQRHMQNLWDKDYWLVQEDGGFVQLPAWVKYDPNPDMTDPLCPYGKQRGLLQWWGTEFRRNVNVQYWINKLAKTLEKDKPEIALICDVRFPNEVEFAKQYGDVIRVDRKDLPKIDNTSHPSETALLTMPDSEWACVLNNDSSLEVFKERSVAAFDAFLSSTPKGYGHEV